MSGIEIANARYILGIPDRSNVRFGTYSMHALVLHCNVHVYFVLQLHTLHTRSPTHWHVIVKSGMLYREFLVCRGSALVPKPDTHWKGVEIPKEVSGSWTWTSGLGRFTCSYEANTSILKPATQLLVHTKSNGK